MNGLVQDWFRSLVGGLILADMIGHFRCSDTGATGPISAATGWPQVWLALARGTVQGELASLRQQQSALQSLEATAPVAAVLALMPLVLVTPEMVARAAKPLHLQRDTWTRAGSLRQHLWNIAELEVPGVPLFPSAAGGISTDAWQESSATRACWLQAQAISQTCSGQFALSLQQLSDDDKGDLFPLVGLLGAARGIHQLPLCWRDRWLRGEQLRSRWQLDNEQAIWQLADQLYRRWAGIAINRHYNDRNNL